MTKTPVLFGFTALNVVTVFAEASVLMLIGLHTWTIRESPFSEMGRTYFLCDAVGPHSLWGFTGLILFVLKMAQDLVIARGGPAIEPEIIVHHIVSILAVVGVIFIFPSAVTATLYTVGALEAGSFIYTAFYIWPSPISRYLYAMGIPSRGMTWSNVVTISIILASALLPCTPRSPLARFVQFTGIVLTVIRQYFMAVGLRKGVEAWRDGKVVGFRSGGGEPKEKHP